jgi:hypothetical protein
MRRSSVTFVAIVISTAFPLLCTAQTNASASSGKLDIKLVAIYKNNALYDISSDAKLLLFYGASTPIKDTNSSSVTEWRPIPEQKYSKALRVVRLEDGRELGATSIRYPSPRDARFVGETTRICFSEEKLKLWDYLSNERNDCEQMPVRKHFVLRQGGPFERQDSPSGRYTLEASLKTTTNLLVVKYVRGVIAIVDRSTGKNLGTATHPKAKKWAENIGAGLFYSLAMTNDDKYLVTYYEFDSYLWQITARDK